MCGGVLSYKEKCGGEGYEVVSGGELCGGELSYDEYFGGEGCVVMSCVIMRNVVVCFMVVSG